MVGKVLKLSLSALCGCNLTSHLLKQPIDILTGVIMSKVNHVCRNCGDTISQGRWALGYKFCLPCGDEYAKTKKFTVVPMHKSNYVACFDMADLKGINNKGGLVK